MVAPMFVDRERLPVRLAVMFGVGKGVTISAVMFALGVQFWQQIVIATVGATITSIGVVLAAYIALRGSERNRTAINRTRREVEHVKRGLGIERRAEDGSDLDA